MSNMTLAERLRDLVWGTDIPLTGEQVDDLLEAADRLEQYVEEQDYTNLPPLSSIITNITPARNPFMEMLNKGPSECPGWPT